jgi:hypothetical protein
VAEPGSGGDHQIAFGKQLTAEIGGEGAGTISSANGLPSNKPLPSSVDQIGRRCVDDRALDFGAIAAARNSGKVMLIECRGRTAYCYRWSTKSSRSLVAVAEISIPADACPVKFEPLNVELGCNLFGYGTSKRRSDDCPSGVVDCAALPVISEPATL